MLASFRKGLHRQSVSFDEYLFPYSELFNHPKSESTPHFQFTYLYFNPLVMLDPSSTTSELDTDSSHNIPAEDNSNAVLGSEQSSPNIIHHSSTGNFQFPNSSIPSSSNQSSSIDQNILAGQSSPQPTFTQPQLSSTSPIPHSTPLQIIFPMTTHAKSGIFKPKPYHTSILLCNSL